MKVVICLINAFKPYFIILNTNAIPCILLPFLVFLFYHIELLYKGAANAYY